jgi:hypothetical protein
LKRGDKTADEMRHLGPKDPAVAHAAASDLTIVPLIKAREAEMERDCRGFTALLPQSGYENIC